MGLRGHLSLSLPLHPLSWSASYRERLLLSTVKELASVYTPFVISLL